MHMRDRTGEMTMIAGMRTEQGQVREKTWTESDAGEEAG